MTKRNDIAKALLATIAAAGVITIAITAPNLIGVFGIYQKTKYFHRKKLTKSFKNLKERGLIKVSKQRSNILVRLTKSGKEILLKHELKELTIPCPKKWDGKWHFVIFDIPERFKINRDYFVIKLKSMGFVCLQKSIWTHPYACEQEINYFKNAFGIQKYVKIITAESFKMEKNILKMFKLPH